jgi:hypothetical protein
MSRNFTFPEKKHLRIAAGILLMIGTGCNPKMDNTRSGIQFSADKAENSHLKHIFFGCNRDSVCKCAQADYIKQKYYIFWTGAPGEIRFTDYLAGYAKKRYNLILIKCGCKSRPGAYYYNNQTAAFFLKAKKKSLGAIYLEAKDQYNKALRVM